MFLLQKLEPNSDSPNIYFFAKEADLCNTALDEKIMEGPFWEIALHFNTKTKQLIGFFSHWRLYYRRNRYAVMSSLWSVPHKLLERSDIPLVS